MTFLFSIGRLSVRFRLNEPSIEYDKDARTLFEYRIAYGKFVRGRHLIYARGNQNSRTFWLYIERNAKRRGWALQGPVRRIY